VRKRDHLGLEPAGEDLGLKRKPLTMKIRFQNLARPLVTNRKVTDGSTGASFGKWPFRAMPHPQEWDTEPQTLVILFETEQFRGRAVRASRDLWIRGAS
jgi:hypothetical protein